MKLCLAALSLCLCFLTAHAGNTDSLRENRMRRYEIGGIVPVYSDILYNNSEFLALGVQYKKWVHPNVGYRILAGYALTNGEQQHRYGNFGDTSTLSTVHNIADMLFAGFGLEAQKQVYRKIYFFAAVELKIAAGKGTAYEQLETTFDDTASNKFIAQYYGGRGYMDNSIIYVSLSPILGLKFNFKHWSTGLEMHPFNIDYQHISNSLSKSDFISRGSVTERLFIDFRF